jgi:hypothetical protein
MATVSEQLRAKSKPGSAKPAPAKPGTAKPSAGKPAGNKATQAKPEAAKTEQTVKAGPTELDITGETTLNAEQRATLSEAELNTYKENRKKAAFAKLKARAQEKKAANVQARGEQMTAIQNDLEVGQHIFMTRASYYGCEAVIEGFEEVRGRNLVVVRVVSTKKGRALDEDKTYIRKISPKFVQEDRPTVAYVKRRGSAAAEGDEAEAGDVDDMTTAEDEAGTEEEEAGAEAEAESDEGEDESGDEEEEDSEEEDADSEDEDEDEDSEDEDSWGDEE